MNPKIRQIRPNVRFSVTACACLLMLALVGVSSQASAQAADPLPVPISSCTVSEVNGQYQIDWIPGPGAAGTLDRYVVHRQTNGGPIAWRGTADPDATSFTDSGGLATTVRYRVVAKLGPTASTRIFCTDAPAPTGPVPVSSCTVSEVNGQYQIDWTPGAGWEGRVKRHVIQRQLSQGGNTQWRGARDVPTSTFTDTGGLKSFATYRVTAKYNGELSASVTCFGESLDGTKLLAVGDLNACDNSTPGAEAVSALMGEPRYASTPVLILGDIAYPGGSAVDFGCFHDTFGMHKDRMWPMPGNHEYGVGAVNARPWGYINYFRNRAAFSTGFGPQRQISFQTQSNFDELYYEVTGIDGWQVLVLNSNCFKPRVDTTGNGSLNATSCDVDTPQYDWVKDKINSAGTDVCRAVAWHHPLFSTPKAGDPIEVQTNQLEMMELLADTGTDLILAGHAHKYERFEPQNVNAVADPNGFQLIVTGTGGRLLNPFEDPQVIAANSALRVYEFGLSEYTLGDGAYAWTFETTNGVIADQGQRSCNPKSLPG